MGYLSLSLRSGLNSSYMSSALRSVLRVICCDMKRTSTTKQEMTAATKRDRRSTRGLLPALLLRQRTAGDSRRHLRNEGRFRASACPLGHLAQGLPPIRLITSS
jgi:hypothetical protein